MAAHYNPPDKILWKNPKGFCCLCGLEAGGGLFIDVVWMIGPGGFVYCPKCARAKGFWSG